MTTMSRAQKKKLEDVDVQLKTIKKSGIVPEDQYNEYSKALSDWANIGYSIMDKIKAGQKDEAVDQIINECTPKLNKTVELAKEINKLTDERSHQAVVRTSRTHSHHYLSDMCMAVDKENRKDRA